jgi:putative phosphoribosyl transferase
LARNAAPAYLHEVEVGPSRLPGELVVPERAIGVVAFAHGSGSSRHSPRNRQVAAVLQRHRLATLLFDLLHASEARERDLRFDIPLLAARMVAAVDHLAALPACGRLPLGLFGASTGSAAALIAAAERPAAVSAVVSRGGRPDLAAARLPEVRARCLLIVGGDDPEVLALNRQALRLLTSEAALRVVPGATHLFEEAGALDAVAEMAADWFASTWRISGAAHVARP